MATVIRTKIDKTTDSDQSPAAPWGSKKVSRLLDRYTGEAKIVTADDSKEDPITFKAAIEDSKEKKWQTSMKLMMESIYSNSVWELIDLPNWATLIRCKWVFKRKR